MSPTDAAAFAHRYRRRHAPRSTASPIPVANLLWRAPKVPLRREDATEQLELLGPEDFSAHLPPTLPDRERLRLERIQRTIGDTLDGLRPQLNRMVREIQMLLDAPHSRHPDHQVVDDTLQALERHVYRFVDDAIALKRWSAPALSPDA